MPSLWLLIFVLFCFGIGYWGFLPWMPTYLATTRGLTVGAVGAFANLPLIVAFAGTLLWGWLGTVLPRRRPQLTAAAYAMASAALFLTMVGDTGYGDDRTMPSGFLHRRVDTSAGLNRARRGTGKGRRLLGRDHQGRHFGGMLAPAAIGYLVSHTGNFPSAVALMETMLLVAAGAILLLPIVQRGFSNR